MAAGDVKLAYAASSNLTVTNLASIATSATWVAGWTSGTIDNTSNLYLDYAVTGKITVAAAGLSAGEIRISVYRMLDDTNWPDLFSAGTEGTEGTATIHDVNMRDHGLVVGDVAATDTTASQVYHLEIPSVAALFGGNLPAKFALFIAHSTGANLAASGQQVTTKGSYATVAQS